MMVAFSRFLRHRKAKMRRKSLVAAANGPFQGPKIFLEPGEWSIALPAQGGFQVETYYSEDEMEVLDHERFTDTEVIVRGPVMISAFVFDGFRNVFVQAVQISRA